MSEVADADLFDGPGQMRARCRAVDWAGTALGPVSSWPVQLRVMVRVCLDSGSPMSLHWGPSLAVVYNDAFIPLMGSDKHPAALGRSTKDVWPEQWDEVIGPLMQRVVKFGSPVGAEDLRLILDRNGYPEECYFTFSYNPIYLMGEVVGGVFNTVTETTPKVLAQRRLDLVRLLGSVSATQAGTMADTCRAMLDLLATTRQSVPFAVALLVDDQDGRPHGVGAYGLAADAWSLGMSADGFDDEAAVIERVLSTGTPQVLTGLRARYSWAILPGPIGPLVPDEAMIVPLTLARGSVRVGALVLGITPYLRLNEEYRSFLTLIGGQMGVALTDTQAYQVEQQRVRELADQDLAKMEFFQNVSHELRTPLTLLLAPLQDVLDAPGAVLEQYREQLQAVLLAAERLRRMVNALLDFAQSVADVLQPHLAPVDISALTAETASMFRSTAEHAGLRFDVTTPEAAPVIAEVDASMWTTIVTNLIGNAVKFTRHGGVTVTVHATGRNAALTVTDTGIGIAPGEQSRVFDRFYRSPHSSHGGAGIGLALVADLVRAHGGEIRLSSAPGTGSSFTITVPLTAAGQDRPADPVTEQPDTDPWDHPALALSGSGPAPHGAMSSLVPAHTDDSEPTTTPQRARVVLVEDDPDLRTYLTRLLAGDGWQVTAYGDAEAALGSVQSDMTDPTIGLLLTDVVLPGRSGLELVTLIRANRATARVPIIVLTARGGAAAASEGFTAGADDYVTKPFTSQELLARVRANIELHRIREQAVDNAENRALQVQSALESNRVIGTAIGVLMATYRLTADQGFRLLTRASQDHNRKLRDIAAIVVTTRKLPFRPTDNDDLLIKITHNKPR